MCIMVDGIGAGRNDLPVTDDERTPPAISPATLHTWSMGESALYATLIQDPALYQEVLPVITDAVGLLQDRATTTAELAAVADEAAELVREAAAARGVDPATVDLRLAGFSALALRYRQLRPPTGPSIDVVSDT
jgi:hypothetical protein